MHTAHSGLKKGLRGSDRIGKVAKITLDEEESALLSSPQATSYIPRKLRFEDVFSKSSRFILRQLGLEVIFAYKAAAWAHENESCTIRMDFLDLVSSPFHRIISQLLLHVVEFMESALFYSLINCRVNPTLTRKSISRLITSSGRGAGNTYHSTEWSAASLMERVTAYRALLKDATCGEFNSPFRLVQQLSRYLPITVHDASSVNYSKKAVEQRRLWLDTIAHLKELKVDEVGRICGGFNLKKGIDFCGVYFVYPQLRHEVENGSLQPVLSDVTIHFPAGETTAILGKTGSGKSTVLSLIKRMYDPVVAVSLGEDRSVWTKYTGLVDVLRFCLGAQLPPINQSRQENVIMIDGIPLACFSVTFLRNSLGMMEQDPCVFRCLSFLNNLALFTPCTPRERLTAIADLCQCKDFISSRPLAYNSEVGELSAGEKQRLALARAIIMGRNGMGALLLDEPTSHLDGHTEAQLEKATKGFVVGGRFVPTILLVSHRLSVVRSASYIVILGDAQLEFQGPAHGDVLCSNPFFLSVYARQAL
ncbi:unnamed protein product [Trypanosoma congolense IL3000]|uniref:WGS project CAEQ00000000 data, annotated contig 563 n=1 Tax=Trypanosoma congolense (strain IL3000) TaxID=1068625 RepID=F9WGW9_TRYCI|nr:unnamed protein product [Trypanosoma congolense IL3000]